MTTIRVDVDNISEAYHFLNKLTNAGFKPNKDFTWEYANHIRSALSQNGAMPRYVIFQFMDPAVAMWFKLIV